MYNIGVYEKNNSITPLFIQTLIAYDCMQVNFYFQINNLGTRSDKISIYLHFLEIRENHTNH
jgi:hypothetical protein